MCGGKGGLSLALCCTHRRAQTRRCACVPIQRITWPEGDVPIG